MLPHPHAAQMQAMAEQSQKQASLAAGEASQEDRMGKDAWEQGQPLLYEGRGVFVSTLLTVPTAGAVQTSLKAPGSLKPLIKDIYSHAQHIEGHRALTYFVKGHTTLFLLFVALRKMYFKFNFKSFQFPSPWSRYCPVPVPGTKQGRGQRKAWGCKAPKSPALHTGLT